MNRQSEPRAALGSPPPGLFGKLLTLLAGVAFLAVAFMFSLVALLVVAVVGSIFAGWLWWKTRALRQAMREAAPVASEPEGPAVIEGEFSREADDGGRR